jgi:hypothetical protein
MDVTHYVMKDCEKNLKNIDMLVVKKVSATWNNIKINTMSRENKFR